MLSGHKISGIIFLIEKPPSLFRANKYSLSLIFCLLFCQVALAQTNPNVHYMQWVFGYDDEPGVPSEFNIGWNIMDFNNGIVKIEEYNPSVELYTLGRTGSVVCDSTGQVELVTNICDLRDENFFVVPGGEVLTDNLTIQEERCDEGREYPTSHASRFYPRDEGYDLIYLDAFDEFLNNNTVRRVSSKNLYQLRVKGSRENGYELSSEVLLQGLFEHGRLKTTYHANGKDIWVIMNPHFTDTLHSYLLVDTTLTLNNTSVLGPKLLRNSTEEPGFYSNVAFSANNDMMTMVSPVGIMLYDFDDETGAFTDYRNFEIPFFGFSGVCFSPSDRFLYAGNADNLYQVDLESDRENPLIHDYGSLFTTEIDAVGWPIGVGNMVTGPDCRIYVSAGSTSNFMHVIHNPEGEGEEAELQKYIPLPNRFFFDFPTIPNLFPNCDPTIEFDIRTSVIGPVDAAFPMVVFPNPASEFTTINIDPNYEGQLTVVDMNGRIILQDVIRKNTYEHQLEVSSWPSGMYLLRYESALGVFTGKLVVE